MCGITGCLLCLLSAGARAQTTAPASEATTIATASPTGVAYDASGDLYIALQADHKIVMVDTNGIVTTIAGTGEQGFGGDGGAATSALLDSPTGVAVDSSGDIFVADTHNNRIREIANGIITTVAGSGVAGFSGDSGPAGSAQLSYPTAVSVDTSGNLYIADSNNHRIRFVSGGTITTVAGNGEQIFSGDGGPATAAGLDTPSGVAADPAFSGRFYISDTHNQRVRLVDASGNISTLAGSGTKGFGGDGGSASTAVLARPRGLTVDASGNLYLADSDNNRVRGVASGTITTISGDGEQGFAGDSGAATSAVLDTPTAVAAGPASVIAFSDTHNQRTRAIASSGINTVAGIALPGTEGIAVAGALTNVYGSGSLTATFSNGTGTASGTATLLDGGVAAGTVSFSGNQAVFDLSKINAGLHAFVVSYAGDNQNAATASGEYVVTISQAAQTINFPQPDSPVVYGVGVSTTLNATSTSGIPVTYTVTGPATLSGSTLTFTGGGTVTVTAAVTNPNYVAASVTRTITVTAVALAGLAPASATLGDPAKTITLTGAGFLSNSSVLVNGAAVPTTFINETTLSITLPASSFTTPQTLQISVVDPTQNQSTSTLPFLVAAPAVNVAVTAPPTSNPGTQPSVSLTLASPYPVPVTATLTLTFTPGANGVDDPAIVFSNGLRTLTLDLAAGQTTVPAVQIQTGTVSGTITISLALTAGEINVTPANFAPAVITIPTTPPAVTDVSVMRSGQTLTVTTSGYSDTRQVTQATFHFTAANGADIDTKDVTVDVTTPFTDWFSQSDSNAYGSEFRYTQVFNLTEDSSVIGTVTVTLTNSSGASTPASTQ